MNIGSQKKRVSVVGMGNIGLPTACVLASSGYLVYGVDAKEEVVNRLNANDLINPEPNLKTLLKTVIRNGTLQISTMITSADIYLIAVPTPLDSHNQPDLSHVNSAIETIKPHLRPLDLVLIESTCPIGTTDTVAHNLKTICPEVCVAYCPERVLPGNILYELKHNDRVVGGVDSTSTRYAADFYQSFILGNVLTSNARTAEAVKLIENTYRDINLAYANELSMVADRLHLEVKELIRLANRHPRVQILNPGIGVGGHCIPVDPWFLINSASDLTQLSSKAREVNKNKTNWVIEKIREVIEKDGSSTVACLGLTYKPNVSDIRESPALTITSILEKECEVIRVDPYVENTETVDKAIARADIVVGLVAHSAFSNVSLVDLQGKIVLDFAGIFT